MVEPQNNLQNFKPKRNFLVAIDSDGCVFDNMELKHKECFIPNTIKYWNLQAISRYARQAAEFVNLYSTWRGINRFPALIKVFDLLADWPEVRRRNVNIPRADALRSWIERETKLGDPQLRKEIAKTNDPVLNCTLQWSEAVNTAVADMVHDIPPYRDAIKSMQKLHASADIIVCSVTHTNELRREWQQNDIAQYARIIAGQELGTKEEQIRLVAAKNYPPNRMLMIGDAPGDLKAAHTNNALFYPIIPGQEEQSWERFYHEIIDHFFAGRYKREIEKELIDEFHSYLPERPPWKK